MRHLIILFSLAFLASGVPVEDASVASTTITADVDDTTVEVTTISKENEAYVEELTKRAETFLAKVEKVQAEWKNKEMLANWKYASDLTSENLAEKLNVSAEAARQSKILWQEAITIPWQDLRDKNLRRQFEKITVLGYSALPEELYVEYQKTVSDMENIYSTAKICSFQDKTKCDLALEPELTVLMAKSRNPDELKHIWVEWRKVSGEKVKHLYPRYVELANMAAKLNNFSDNAAYWLKEYEANDFPEQIESLWQELKPFYLQLHAYVRRELRKKYGENVVSKDGPIPAHLLGNMWAQTWSNIADFTTPHPGAKLPDVTDSLVAKGYNATGIFRLAEDFFVSINLTAMPDSFWEKSILTKQEDKQMICHASAWDFYDSKDFRIKQCTRINMEDLHTAHHEMGHVEYFLQYKNQPTVFKEGANPGFHEAVGDVIALSASTPQHLRTIGLLEDDSSQEAALNHLYSTGLDKIVFLPFAYAMDKWRWDVFEGKTTTDNYNCHWWELISDFQGVEPPVDRSEADFDPGAKYHIIADVEYLRYYVSFVIQFQFHKALCTAAKQYDPQNPSSKLLHECDIYNSKEAGNLLKSMLELGSSKPWQDAMEKITGQRKMDASGLLEYFSPLMEWLKKENEKTGEYIGWKPSTKRCVQTRSELVAEESTE